MKTTKSGHRKARLINQKIAQEKFMKNVCNYIVWLRKQQKNLIINISGAFRLEHSVEMLQGPNKHIAHIALFSLNENKEQID